MIWQCGNCVKLKEFIMKHFLIICELIAVGLAFAWPLPGSKLSNPTISLCIVAVIFLSTGLKLKTDELKAIYKKFNVVLICCVTSLLVSSLLPSFILHQLPFGEVSTAFDDKNDASFNFGPQELQLGMILFNCAPATIATGIVMVTTADGDVITAVSVSTITNIIGCFSAPLLFSLFVDTDVMKQDSLKLLQKIGLSLLLPLVVGKIISMLFKPVRTFVANHKKKFGLFQSVGICLILWIKLSKSIENGTFKLISLTDILILFGLILACHLLILIINTLLSVTFCLRREQVCVMLLLVSQKTLVLTSAMASALPEAIGDTALILLPCFIAHPLQMMVDSFLIQPLKNTKHFPLCVPAFCERCYKSEKTSNEEPEQSSFNLMKKSVITGTIY